MLVLARKLGERIVVPACGLTITVSAIRGNTVRLGISAPDEIEVHREEVWRQLCLQVSGGSDRSIGADSAASEGS